MRKLVFWCLNFIVIITIIQCQKSIDEPIFLNKSSFTDDNFIIIQSLLGFELVSITASIEDEIVISGILGRDDFGLLKLDANEEEKWLNNFGDKRFERVQELITTRNGDFVMVGGSTSFSSGNNDVYIVRTSNNGAEIWESHFGTSVAESGVSIIETTDRGFVVAAFSSEGLFNSNSFRLKVDQRGREVWSHIDTFSTSNSLSSVLELADSTYLFSGFSRSSFNLNIELTNVDKEGELIWKKTIHNLEASLADFRVEPKIQRTNDGNILLASNTSLDASSIILTKLTPFGDILWTKEYGGIQGETFSSVIEIDNEGYILIGTTRTCGNGNEDILLIKMDFDGEEIWTKTHGNEFSDSSTDAVKINDTIYIIGTSNVSEEFEDRRQILLRVDKNGNPVI